MMLAMVITAVVECYRFSSSWNDNMVKAVKFSIWDTKADNVYEASGLFFEM